ncbi:MAG: hypothetical protein HOE90_00455 [Bacteriovoracaceae bacterium]|nr:hypothetical protein [Bacteriovoracaceae bacterium]
MKLITILALALSSTAVFPSVFSPEAEFENKAFSYIYIDQKLSPHLGLNSLTPDPEVKLVNGLSTRFVRPAARENLNYLKLSRVPCYKKGARPISYSIEGAKKITVKLPPCKWDASSPLRFSFIADTQEFPERAKNFSDKLAKNDSHFFIHAGDHVQTGKKESHWQKYFLALESARKDRLMLSAVGNHEYRYGKKARALWQKYFGKNFRNQNIVLKIGDAVFIMFNSNFADDPALVLGQLRWLNNALKTPVKWKFVIMHHPPYSRTPSHSKFYWKKEFLALREHYIPLFERYKVDAVLSGHTHIYERSVKKGIQYVTAGAAGGKMGIMGGKNKYSVIAGKWRTLTHFTLTPNKLTMLTEDLDGHRLDTIEINKK